MQISLPSAKEIKNRQETRERDRHTLTHPHTNVMNIYESVRTTPKCKTRAKSQKYSHTSVRKRKRDKRASEKDREIAFRIHA